jgi:hypothetical protein
LSIDLQTTATAIVGQPTTITIVNQDGAPVAGAVVYAPVGTESIEIGRANALGVITWVPQSAGPYLLTAVYGALSDSWLIQVNQPTTALPTPTVVVDNTQNNQDDDMRQRYAGDTTLAFTFQLLNSSDVPVTGLSPTVKISKNGGPLIDHSGTVTEVGLGVYSYRPSVDDVRVAGPFYLSASGGAAVPLLERWELLQNIQSPTTRG